MDSDEILKISKIAFIRLILSPKGYRGLIYSSRDGRIREPEVRYIFCNVLDEKGYKFGLEVPTKNKYHFTGKTSQRALTDLSIFGGGKQEINIEFKEGPSPQKQIDKDVEKLIRETKPGVLIHFLPTRENNLNSEHPGILKKRIIKLNNSFNSLSNKFKAKDNFWILFVIMVRDHKELWYLTKQKENLGKISLEEFKKVTMKI